MRKTLFVSLLLSVATFVSAQEMPASSVRIIAPINSVQLPEGGDVTVRFGVRNFVFVDFKNNREPFPGNPNAGHAHLWVDDMSFNHDAAQKILSTDPISLGALKNGEHTIAIELTQNDHTPFHPPVRASVTFDVGKKSIFSGIAGGTAGGPLGMVVVVLLAAAAGGFIWWFLRRQATAKP